MDAGILCPSDARQTWKSFLKAKEKTIRSLFETPKVEISLSSADRVQNNGCMAKEKTK